jgi:hemoglobin-like flavoprotein
MTEEQIMLVKNSWKTFRNVDAGVIGDLFYSKLFLDHPRLQKMFPSVEQQHRKLIDMLSYIVSRIDKPETMMEDIKALGIRHEGYGVKPEHYKLVGDALLWTIERGMGKDWNNAMKAAWTAFYSMIATTMIAAAKNKQHIN